MKVGIGQINARVGDFSANAAKISDACSRLARGGADFAVFPECAVSGYLLGDLVGYNRFVEAAQAALASLAETLPIPAIVGCPRLDGGPAGNDLRGHLDAPVAAHRAALRKFPEAA